jgi:hypothetical protein
MGRDEGPFPDGVLGRWAARVRTAIPAAVAIIAKGSVARGDASPWSDLQLRIGTRSSLTMPHGDRGDDTGPSPSGIAGLGSPWRIVQAVEPMAAPFQGVR